MAAKKKSEKKKKVDAVAAEATQEQESAVQQESAMQQESAVREDGSSSTTTTTESTKLRGQRSVVQMYKVIVKKGLGKKFKVSYNENGNPNGRTRSKLQSYIGMVARKTVPINIKNWSDVSGDDKEKLWEDVENTFKVAPESKKLVLISAGTKWRQFKTNLTRQHVLPYLGDKKKLRKPPKKYSFVGRKPWKLFVKQRSTPEWLKLHEAQSNRVKKRKCHHKISRKGYIGLEDELRKTLPVGEVIDRAVLWKKARLLPDGKMDPDVIPIVQKIDELLEKKSKGELTITGGDDILSQALGNPEHPGRVRGVGGYVQPATYFNLPKQRRARITIAELLARDKERDRELEEAKRKFEEEANKLHEYFERRMKELEGRVSEKPTNANIETPISDKGSIHYTPVNRNLREIDQEDDCEVIPSPPPPNVEVGICELAVDVITNVVAFGTIIDDPEMQKTLHNCPMPEGCVRVSVDGVIKGDAPLPVPIKGAVEFVYEALGTHVAWPEELIIRKQPVKKIKKKLGNVRSLFGANELPSSVPKRCKLLYKHAKDVMGKTNEALRTVLDDQVFGTERQLYILRENILDFLEMKQIGQGVLAAYMAYLHDFLKEKDQLEVFAFVDPEATFQPEREEFQPYLLNRLREGKSDRIFFIPYNPKEHWILTVLWENEIYILDSLSRPHPYRQWENILICVVKQFNAETGRTGKPKVTRLHGVAAQVGGVECGYYVMQFMKEIVNDETLSFPTKWVGKKRSPYDQSKIDEVRLEVADYIQALL